MKRFSVTEAIHVVSEPGDSTRYDYMVYRDGPDEFVFTPTRSTFIFPLRINYFDIAVVDENGEINIDVDEVHRIAEKYNSNPWTVMECCRTVKELHDTPIERLLVGDQ